MNSNKDKKDSDKHPDFTGRITIKPPNGEAFEMWASGWMRVSKDGKDYISLAFSEMQEKSSGRSLSDMKAAAAKNKPSIQQELDDEVPF